MNRSASFIFCLLAVAIAGGAVALWQPWQRDFTDVADVDTTAEDGARGRGTVPLVAAGDSPRRPDSQADKKPTPAVSKSVPRPVITEGIDDVTTLAKRLGWEAAAPDVAAVFEWNRQLESERDEFLETHSRGESGAEEVRRAARGYNDSMASKRHSRS